MKELCVLVFCVKPRTARYLYCRGEQCGSVARERSIDHEEQEVLSLIEEQMGRPLPHFDWFAGNRVFGVRVIKSQVFLLLVNHRDLSHLPDNLGNLTKLRALDAGRNSLTSVPRSIARCRDLSQLFLGRNRITSLPSEISQLSNLHILELQRNQLRTIPHLSSFPKLRRLFLYGNHLATIPAGWQTLTQIEELRLDQNEIAVVENCKTLPKLETFNLADNHLDHLPGSFQKLKGLKSLDLSSNKFTEFPRILRTLSNLEELFLMGNDISTLQYEDFAALTNLRILDIKGNPIPTDELTKIKAFARMVNPKLFIRHT